MQRPNLYDYLKVLALLSMIIDHIGYFLYPEEIWRRVFGRLAFPLFLLLVWYNGSYRRRWSLWWAGMLLQALIWYGWKQWMLIDPLINILLVIWVTRTLLWRLTKKPYRLQSLFFFSGIALAPTTFAFVDYGTLCVSVWLVWWRMRRKRTSRAVLWWAFFVLSYLVLMIWDRGFPEETRLVLLVLCVFLFLCCTLLMKENKFYPMHPIVDRGIVRLSTYALWVYLFHGGLLLVLAGLFVG